jgi:hypothetical protein
MAHFVNIGAAKVGFTMNKKKFFQSATALALALGSFVACGRQTDTLSVSYGQALQCAPGQVPSFNGTCWSGGGFGVGDSCAMQGLVKVAEGKCKGETTMNLLSSGKDRGIKVHQGRIMNSWAPAFLGVVLGNGDKIQVTVNNPNTTWGTGSKCDVSLKGMKGNQQLFHDGQPQSLHIRVSSNYFADISDSKTLTVSGVTSNEQALAGFKTDPNGVSWNNLGSTCNLNVTLRFLACRDYNGMPTTGCGI